MIFPLIQDFADVLDAMPCEHSRHRILNLLDEAIRRDVHFIDRYPTTLLQCLWNTCWWYDCLEAAGHYDLGSRTENQVLPWEFAERSCSSLLEHWLDIKQRSQPGFFWFRSRRPPRQQLAAGQMQILQGHAAIAAPFLLGRDFHSDDRGIDYRPEQFLH